MCSLAGRLNMKLMCTVVRKYTADFVSFVWQCKCACKLKDALVGGLIIFENIWEPSQSFSY